MNDNAEKRRNIEVLAAAALYRKAGVNTVLDALREYRLACSNGTVRVAPRYAVDQERCAWLYETPEEA